MGALALLTLAATLGAGGVDAQAAALTPRQKAALVVISGLPAPAGVGGVFVGDARAPRPAGTLVFVDQEGGAVKDLAGLPPWQPARGYATAAEARAAGRATGAALRRSDVQVDLAPVLDAPSGPLGSRHFRAPALGVAFARGLRDGGAGACPKHFPGLGTAAVSTDERPQVRARVTAGELAAFRAAVRAGVPCVMVGHAFYPSLGGGRFRATLEPEAYRLLRSLGFRGVAITDSMNVVASPPSYWPTRAIRAGADMLLYTSPVHARRAIDALVPLARRGELDAKVARVLRLRREYGMEKTSRSLFLGPSGA
jgi:beta-N-acetylhexosaminidase